MLQLCPKLPVTSTEGRQLERQRERKGREKKGVEDEGEASGASTKIIIRHWGYCPGTLPLMLRPPLLVPRSASIPGRMSSILAAPDTISNLPEICRAKASPVAIASS